MTHESPARDAVEHTIRVQDLLSWIDTAWPVRTGSDFNQGVIRGFEIIKAQLEAGHIQSYCAALTRTEAMGHTPKRGDKIKWARGLERRPLAVRDLEFVTVASWGLPDAPLVVTLKEVAGTFPMGLFDRLDPVEAEMDA